jgi:hypothetical protein
MTTNTSKFNLTVTNLIDDLIIICGDDIKNLKSFKTQFELLKRVNPKVIMNQFNINIIPFTHKIKMRDESFFIEKDYQEEVDKNVKDESYTQHSLDQILNLKEIWKSLSDNNKSIIWDYFNVLVLLVELEYNPK